MKAVGVLGVLLATVTLMTAACILLPLAPDPAQRGPSGRGTASRLLCGDRLRLHARGDLAAAAADDLPRPSGLQPVGRPVLAARVERRGQPFHRARCRRRGGPRDATTAADHAGGARRLWHRHAGHHAPLRRRGHTGAHPDRRRHPPAGRLLPGDGVSTRDAPRPAAFAVNRALALGRQRRNVGVRVGPRRRHRHRRGHIGRLLGGRGLLSGVRCSLALWLGASDSFPRSRHIQAERASDRSPSRSCSWFASTHRRAVGSLGAT